MEGTIAIRVNRNRLQVQACPGLRLAAYASESATAFEYVSSAIKPMRPLDQGNSYIIQVWARGSGLRTNRAFKTRGSRFLQCYINNMAKNS